MASSTSERTPLLDRQRPQVDEEADAGLLTRRFPSDPHAQFCLLTGVPPSDLRTGAKWPKPPNSTIYGRATRHRNAQKITYVVTATVANSLLLGQVLLGALVTALGASSSSHVLITVFGAMNTVIAGLVAYLKSRGQPQRARMFLDDLERIVDELEDSEIMWLGIAGNADGYHELIGEDVTVRSEVARLTTRYDNAVKSNTRNNPDALSGGQPADMQAISTIDHKTGGGSAVAAVTAAEAQSEAFESPMTAMAEEAVKKKAEDKKKEEGKKKEDDDKKNADKGNADKKDDDKADDTKTKAEPEDTIAGSSKDAQADASTSATPKAKASDDEEL